METQLTNLTPEEQKILDSFKSRDAVEIDCETFKAFYKPMSVNEDIEWTREYLVDDGAGNFQLSGKELLKCKMHYNLNVRIPKSVVKVLTQKDVEWKDLTKEEKYSLITEKLDPAIARKIIAAIRNADEGTPEKKN